MNSSEHYDWYEEDFVSFLLSLDLPAYRKDMPIDKAVKGEQESFINALKEMIAKKRFRFFSNSFYSALSSILPQIKDNFSALINIIDYYDNADMAAAQYKFDELMESLKEYLFVRNIYWPYLSTDFYRIRVSPEKVLNEPKELFHIPYNKRHLISNERYSLAGHPCLYLSSYLHIAWQECGYPYEYYYSEFQYQFAEDENNEWKFITFLSPQFVAKQWFISIREPEEIYLKLAQSYLLTYPLIFACSIVNLNGKSAFKPEFVIPQMLTQWVYRNYDFAKGIKYFSCYNTDDIRHFNGYNVVLPAKNIDKRRGYSKDLVSKFKVSKPVLINNKLDEKKADTVKKYKQDLSVVKQNAFMEADECLQRLYYISDLFDKTIRNTEKSDMQLVVSIIRNIIISGVNVLKNYSKNKIIDSFRLSQTYTDRMEGKIKSFSDLYDRFQKDILKTAEQFDSMFDRLEENPAKEFFDIYTTK